ncbi:hypothetical protein [Burkholderia gladioli]|uniref:Uncharacterized protein n=2 Tax=Burkholderia gladioli TaxID=28095 RepID=A0AB38U0E7_BURGA|nr:hypothetical protein [Burkholderia gladioli]MCA8166586.1 hypothetical protein [Burkholderia gladioli]UWX73433.1 hypothetical protein NYZ96_34115 [Burkholderia gladioli]
MRPDFRRAALTRRAKVALNLSHYRRIVSWLTLTPRSNNSSSMSRRLCWKRKYPRAIRLVPNASEAPDDAPTYLGAKLRLRARRSSRAVAFTPSRWRAASQLPATGFVSGIWPCVGSIFVLIASVAALAPWIGIAASFAIAAGVALTVTLFGLGAIGANRFISGRGIHLRTRLQATQRAVAIAGAGAIVCSARCRPR